MKAPNRKLLQDEDGLQTTLSPSITYSTDPLLEPINGTSTVTIKRPMIKANTPFDSSMALTILVLLTALFFMGFFSIYIRRFADESSVDISRRRRNHRPPRESLSSSIPPSRFNHKKGLNPSAVRSLPLVSYGGDAKYLIDCVICLSEFEEREAVKMIPYCRHVFHPRCIDTWLASNASCPVCRSTQISPAEEESRSGVEESRSPSCGVQQRSESTVIDVDTWAEEGMEVGPVGMRRSSSCSSIGVRSTELQRTMSF